MKKTERVQIYLSAEASSIPETMSSSAMASSWGASASMETGAWSAKPRTSSKIALFFLPQATTAALAILEGEVRSRHSA